jgi:hypothetical protein
VQSLLSAAAQNRRVKLWNLRFRVVFAKPLRYCRQTDRPLLNLYVLDPCMNCNGILVTFSRPLLLKMLFNFKMFQYIQGLNVCGFHIPLIIYRVSQKECGRLRENVPYVKVHRYNPKYLYLKLNGYGNMQKSNFAYCFVWV